MTYNYKFLNIRFTITKFYIVTLYIFFISVKPFCKPDQVQVYGVAKREKIRVSCDVIANPSSDLKFHWVFNSSSERLDLQENLVEVRGTRSLAHHMPQVKISWLYIRTLARFSAPKMRSTSDIEDLASCFRQKM
jgi:hypothetical protein